jgi:hypothetical protein
VQDISDTEDGEYGTEILDSKPVDSGPQNSGAGAPLEYSELCTWANEIRLQPSWREESNRCEDYRDGNQINADILDQLEKLGIAWVPENLIGPTIRSVTGLEAKTRKDWRVAPANDKRFQDLADAVNVKLNEAEKETRADRAQADAYRDEVTAGLGWVEVGRNPDPLATTRYRVEHISRGQIFWDWQRRKPDMSDARYLIRKKRHPLSLLTALIPEKADLFQSLAGNSDSLMITDSQDTGLARDVALERSFAWDDDWLQPGDDRVMIYEVWYRRWVRAQFIRVADTGMAAMFDPQNPLHVDLVRSGRAELINGVTTKMRVSWWAGPYPLFDMETPFPHNDFPYVPFWGFVESNTGVPFGLVRDMIPLQDDINARNSKMLALLASKRIEMTSGVLKNMSAQQAKMEATKPNSMFVMDEQKIQAGGFFKITTDFELANSQRSLVEDKRAQIKNVAGVYASFEGRADSGVTAGVALQTLVDQSNQSLGTLNDNFAFGHQKVGELLLSLIIEDLGEKPQEVTVDMPGKPARVVTINALGDDGNPADIYALQKARLKVQISDVPSTPSYRQQQLQQMTQIMQSLPPNLQALLMDYYISLTDSPYRDAIVERLRTALQLPGEDGQAQQMPKTPEQLKQVVQQAVQQALQQAGQSFEVEAKKREIAQKDKELTIKEFEAWTRRLEVQKIKAFDSETKRIAVENDDEHQTLRAGMDLSAQQFSQPSDTGAPAVPPQTNSYPQPSDTGSAPMPMESMQ